jgi:DNA ligase (NAD+)
MERLGIGADGNTTLKIIKANKIIPKCVGVTEAKGSYVIPDRCPVCHEKTEVLTSSDGKTKTLHCTNDECPAKKLRNFVRFVSRQGMDIEGLSIKTLLLFINQGYITTYESIYELSNYEEDIRNLPGFGDKSCSNIMNAIEHSKEVSAIPFIYALGIPLIGTDAAKRIIQKIGYQGFVDRTNQREAFDDIDGIGAEKSNAINAWFDNPQNRCTFDALNKILVIRDEKPSEDAERKCVGFTFVITGDVHVFKNRAEFVAYVEKQGGNVTGSVSSKTNYLVNNDAESTSSKNRKAKALGVPIISEEEFVTRFGR